ncbi:unnamed protein product [Owenia fusiformis]|uniref:Uncharacterized protein n=1 Tax=Owenia fusiformis TaxID=6347 RepID=A0A8J1TA24_OWEFU|nr:unnamed protein product [Owenia fusiformis]
MSDDALQFDDWEEPTKEQLSHALLQAVKSNNEQYVQLLVEMGADTNYEGPNRTTPLMCAIRDAEANVDLVNILLSAGCDLNKKSKLGDTALHEAVKARSRECVEILLSAGADVNIQTFDGITPLHMAAEDGQLRIIKQFIQAGCDVNLKSHNGASALHFAAVYDHMSCVNELLQNGANPDIMDRRRRTPLMYALERNNEEVANLLLDHRCSLNMLTDNKDSVLHSACLAGCLNCVKKLISLGSKINAKNLYDDTPAVYAVMNGHVDILRYLIQQKCNLEFCNKETGRSCMHVAAYYGHVECLDVLVEAGCDIDALDYDHNTPLMDAVCEAQVESVKYLIEKGANVNNQNKQNETPILCIDVEKPNTFTIAKLIIQANCDLRFSNEAKIENPFDSALRMGRFTVAKLLAYAGCTTSFIAPKDLNDRRFDPNRGHMNWLCEFNSNARSLTEISRLAIRDTLREYKTCPKQIDLLPIPITLKQFLKFEDLDDLDFEFGARGSMSQSTQMMPGHAPALAIPN